MMILAMEMDERMITILHYLKNTNTQMQLNELKDDDMSDYGLQK